MKFPVRAAAIAAVTFCAGAIAVSSTPGFAWTPETATIVENAAIPMKVPGQAAMATVSDTDIAHDSATHRATAPVAEIADADVALPKFSTLSAAVDAQPVPDAPDSELRCLATGIYFESKGEPLAGQLAVAEVILNRAASGRFPGSVCGVLMQPGQFSFVRSGRLPSPPNNAAWRKAVAVAEVARRDLWDSPVSNALFFHARYVSPGWRRARVGSVGNHIFYR